MVSSDVCLWNSTFIVGYDLDEEISDSFEV